MSAAIVPQLNAGRIYDEWTPEDFQRLNRLNLKRKLVALSMVRLGDRVDYRAMMAREVYKEREWRAFSIAHTPVTVQMAENLFGPMRLHVEAINGEVLA